ncbi:hypothetical protein [Noviherbaspirillum soli]|uniref:hypothetical protein n=1 Tax=Noviherbaspirillum soli TaxID=1064518 RepID=UPI00188BE786|nr:hypothetical protein [Noviherbaspirillum soli]
MDSYFRLNRLVNKTNNQQKKDAEKGLEIDHGRASEDSAIPASGTSHTLDVRYLEGQPRPPLDDGMSDLRDRMFLAFCRGEIPDDPELQSKLAEICINRGFETALAWLVAKTEMTQLNYCSSSYTGQLDTIAKTLDYLGLPLQTLHIDLPELQFSDLEKFTTSLERSHSLKRVDFCDTRMSRLCKDWLHAITGADRNITVFGGIIDDDNPANAKSQGRNVPATALSGTGLKHISRLQLRIQGDIAMSAMEAARQIDFQELSEVRLPGIAGFSAKVKTGLKRFFQKAYEVPYFMLHTTFSSNVPAILSAGRLLSRARLEAQASPSRFIGLKDPSDLENNAHYMVFASMGTNAATLRPPSDYERAIKSRIPCTSFIMNVDAFIQNDRSSSPHIMIKSYDWGESEQQVIRIPNTSITITRCGMDAQNGPVAPGAMIRYRYDNAATHFSKEYGLPLREDIVTGANYRQLIPLLIVQHLNQLSSEEQCAFLHGISHDGAQDLGWPRTAQGILEAFSTLEIALGGSMPLRLEYVDRIDYNGICIDLKNLRNAVKEGRIDEIIGFMQKTSDFCTHRIPDWIIEGIHDDAMRNWLMACAQRQPGRETDKFLAVLDYLAPGHQNIMKARTRGLNVVHAAHDLLLQCGELNAVCVAPSQVNLLVKELSRQQTSIESYLEENRQFAISSVNAFQELFASIGDVSEMGLQSTLKTKVIANPAFQSVIEDPKNTKILLYLAAATPALITKMFGNIDLQLFHAKNRYTGLNIIGGVDGMRAYGAQSKVNQSVLSDLLFNVPVTSLFVASNGKPVWKLRQQDNGTMLEAANAYRLLFGALRDVLRQENLAQVAMTIGERLLLERYDAGKWHDYKERFGKLASLSMNRSIEDGSGESKYRLDAADVIERRSVLDSEYAHFRLDARHLQSILADTYGNAKLDFDDLVNTIAATPEADENHRITAVHLFHRMKLLEFEFYKEQVIGGLAMNAQEKPGAASPFDAYAAELINAIEQN